MISQYGYGKRTKVNQFTAHARGGVGIRSAVVNKKTGDLVGVKALSSNDDEEVIIISQQGQTIRLGLKDIPALGRATQGVRIMRLSDKDSVVSLALVKKATEEEEVVENAELPLDEAPAEKPAKPAAKKPTKK